MSRLPFLFVIVLAAAGLPGCMSFEIPRIPGVTPYRMEVQQGNFVSQEMLDQLKPGMTRDQVKFVLGTPLLADVFHADRWDYPFYLARGNGELTTSRVTVFFKDNKVDHFDGGHLPTEKEYIARIAGAVPAPPPDEQKSIDDVRRPVEPKGK